MERFKTKGLDPLASLVSLPALAKVGLKDQITLPTQEKQSEILKNHKDKEHEDIGVTEMMW
jgi:hypothetical protein